MLTYADAILLGLVQGTTELFPISSLGHSVLLPLIFNWHIDQTSSSFLAFLVMTHLATALVLFGFFWRDWGRIVAGILRSLIWREISERDTYAKIGWLLFVSTIPAGILGLLLETSLQQFFGAGTLVAIALMCNGFILYSTEALCERIPDDTGDDVALARLSWGRAVWIGLVQSLALIPGFSRTGLAMAGGLMSGLSHENAARYAFLLATPVIFAAALLKVPEVFGNGATFTGITLAGALSAAISSYFSVRFLVRYFETKTLKPFAAYCVLAGLIALFLIP